LFVPTLQAGYEITTSLALTGQKWINLYPTTPLQWAYRFAEENLLENGKTRLSEDADLFFIEELLKNANVTESESYFHGQEIRVGFMRAFLKTLHAMRLAGVKSEQLSDLDVGKNKLKPLARLLNAYSTYLKDHKIFDDADVFNTAIERITNTEPKKKGCNICCI